MPHGLLFLMKPVKECLVLSLILSAIVKKRQSSTQATLKPVKYHLTKRFLLKKVMMVLSFTSMISNKKVGRQVKLIGLMKFMI